MAECQDAYFVLRYDKPIQRHVPCLAIRNDEFADLTLDSPANQRMRCQIVNGRLDGCYCVLRCVRVLVT